METRSDTPISHSLQLAFVLLEKSGAPGGTRTPDLLVRSQTLYPTELRARRVRARQIVYRSLFPSSNTLINFSTSISKPHAPEEFFIFFVR
jgi:hypothetical protein